LFAGLLGRGIDDHVDISTAVMIPLVAAMLADGRVDDREIEQIHSICASSPIFERNSAAEIEHLILRATHILENEGLARAFGKTAQVLSVHLRETAFVHAVRVIFSDGYVGELEEQAVEQMIELLSIDRERARMMAEVVSIMQHPATV
jgi:uncharacterized tellurite resistance protein B-like protein